MAGLERYIILRLLQDLHSDTGARVRVGPDISDRFSTSSGVRQGCVLALALFCRAIDWIMTHMQGLAQVKVGDYELSDLDYADDIALPAVTAQDLTASLSSFSDAAQTMGMKVLWPKTKVQCFGVPSPPAPGIVVQGQPVEQVDQFCYLGSSIDSTGRCKPEVMRRIGIASSSMNSLTRV